MYVTIALHAPTTLGTVILVGQVIVEFGFTITIAVVVGPGQPLAVGVIVNVTVCCAVVMLVSVPLMLPLPEAAMPVTFTVLFLVQAYVVPLTAPDIKIVVIGFPVQIVWLEGVATTFGVELTNTDAVTGAPGQPFADGVIVKITV